MLYSYISRIDEWLNLSNKDLQDDFETSFLEIVKSNYTKLNSIDLRRTIQLFNGEYMIDVIIFAIILLLYHNCKKKKLFVSKSLLEQANTYVKEHTYKSVVSMFVLIILAIYKLPVIRTEIFILFLFLFIYIY